MTLHGADSSSPLPVPAGVEVYGVYVAGDTPHVWTGAEFRALGEQGVKGAVAIVVPPQGENWWEVDDGSETLVRLVAGARAWGLYHGSPLCLDVEEAQATAIGAQAQAVEEKFANACATYGYEPWSYGGQTWHEAVGTGHGKRWLAHWLSSGDTSNPPPAEIPAGYDAVQYSGDPSGKTPDLDLFAPGVYFSLDGGTIELPLAEVSTPEPVPAPEPATVEPVESSVATEVEKTDSAVNAQTAELKKTEDAPVNAVHESEIHTLTAKIRVHLQELDDLATQESPK